MNETVKFRQVDKDERAERPNWDHALPYAFGVVLSLVVAPSILSFQFNQAQSSQNVPTAEVRQERPKPMGFTPVQTALEPSLNIR